MSKRKKRKRTKKRIKQRPKKPTSALAMRRFKQKARKNMGNVKVIETELKMSELLIDFMQPYLEAAETLEQYRSLVGMAAIAWNIASLPPPMRPEMLQNLEEFMPSTSSGAFQEIIDELIKRKETYFADVDRLIIQYDVTETDDGGWHLAIASNMAEEEAKREGYNPQPPALDNG